MILVTGATGFVGSVLVRQLRAEGAAVRILRRDTSSLDLLGDLDVDHAIGDVTDPESVFRAMAGVEAVYHVAALVAFGRGAVPRLRAVNVEGTAAVVNAALAAGVGRLVHTSSIAALGRPATPGAVIDGDTRWVDSPMNTTYAVSKRDAEREVARGIAEGLDAVLVNPAVVFGPGRSGEGTFALAERVATGRVPLAPPGGTAVVDVADVAAGLRLACAHGATGRRYVLAAADRSWREILTTLARATGAPPPRGTAPSWLLTAGGALAELGAAVSGRSSPLSRRSAANASATYRYDGSRATDDLGLRYRPFEATAERIAAALGR